MSEFLVIIIILLVVLVGLLMFYIYRKNNTITMIKDDYNKTQTKNKVSNILKQITDRINKWINNNRLEYFVSDLSPDNKDYLLSSNSIPISNNYLNYRSFKNTLDSNPNIRQHNMHNPHNSHNSHNNNFVISDYMCDVGLDDCDHPLGHINPYDLEQNKYAIAQSYNVYNRDDYELLN